MNHIYVTLSLAFLILFSSLDIRSSESDMKIIGERIVEDLMQVPFNDEQISFLMNSITDEGYWPKINYTDLSRTGFENAKHTSYLVTLARAWNKRDSKFYKNTQLKATIESALSFWVENDFICENWWHNQIGTPNNLVNLLLLIGDELPETLVDKTQPIIGRANLNASGARPSGDRIKIAEILARNLLFLKDESRFAEVVKVLENEIKFEMGRGMQYDYSFHHRDDRVNNTLSYGLQFADVFALWADYVHDTKYEFSQEKISILVDYYLDGICKMMVYGKYPDLGAKNRSISRKEALQAMGTSIVEKLAKVTDYRKNELQKIIESRKYGRFTPEFLYSKFFWCSEYYSHQRPAFFTSVRMFSQRNCNMEVPYNGEGLLNHHLGDGANYVYVEGTEYYDIFPVFDWQKIPGTTIVQKPELIPEKDIQKWGLTTFVGGVTDGSYGVTAFDFISPHDSTKAKKSWFFFDNEYVCLGSGIESDKNYPVVTTLNQSHLKGDVIVSVDNKKQISKKGNRQIKNVQYVYHNNIGYFFQIPTAINLSNQIQEGSWRRINCQSDISDKKVAMEVFKLWIDHGINPKNATYEYIVMPAITSNEFEKRIDNRDIQILSNTTNIQSVKHRKLNIIQAVFYKPGLLNISQGNYLKCEDPCLIMLSFNGEKLVKISASDPNRNLESINFSLPIKIEKKQDNFFSKWDDNNKRSDISIRLPSGVYQGESITIYL